MFDVSEMLDRQTADLDPTTKKLIEDQYKKSQENPSIEQSKINSDLKSGQDTFNSGFAGNGMNDAIKQKYSGLLGNKLSSLGQDLKLNARFKQVDQMKKAQSALLAQTQVQNDIFAKNLEANQMKEAARADAINSILGFAGTVGGNYLAKRQEQDAKAGSQARVNHHGVNTQTAFTHKYGHGEHGSQFGEGPGSNGSMSYLESIQGITEMA